MATHWTRALAITACLLIAACGGGVDRTKAQVRLVNASGAAGGYPQLDLRVENTLRQGAVGYGATAGYVEVEPDEADTAITNAGSATPLLSFTPSVAEKRYYTVLAYGTTRGLRQQTLDDNAGEPDANRALLRVFNAADDAGALDIYLTGANESLDTAVPVQANAAYGALGNWITVDSANWRLRVTAAGSKTDLRLDLAALSLPSRHIATLVLTPTGGGLLVNALVLAQRGDITREDTALARVRLAAMVADSGTVGAQVGTITLSPGDGSPSLGDYLLVPTGAPAVALTLNGQALPAAAPTLDPGRDYTLMVHGLISAPRVTWLNDDNRRPADASRTKLRLVNALSEGTAALAMSLDARAVASSVAVGTASAYATPAATTGSSTDGKLAVTATGLPAPVFTANDQLLAADATYSVFLTGRQAAPTGIVRRDR